MGQTDVTHGQPQPPERGGRQPERRWRHNLKPALGLWAADVAVPEASPLCVVQHGQMAWVGLRGAVAWSRLPGIAAPRCAGRARHPRAGGLSAAPGLWRPACQRIRHAPTVPRMKKWPRRVGARNVGQGHACGVGRRAGRAAPAGPAGRGRMCHRDHPATACRWNMSAKTAARGPPSGRGVW